MRSPTCIRPLIPICLVSSDINFVHLVQGLSTTLPWKMWAVTFLYRRRSWSLQIKVLNGLWFHEFPFNSAQCHRYALLYYVFIFSIMKEVLWNYYIFKCLKILWCKSAQMINAWLFPWNNKVCLCEEGSIHDVLFWFQPYHSLRLSVNFTLE